MNRTFNDRVNTAAKWISSGRTMTRTFEGYFGDYDTEVVVVALYRRALKRPSTRFARNFPKYLCEEWARDADADNKHRDDLQAWSEECVKVGKAEDTERRKKLAGLRESRAD